MLDKESIVCIVERYTQAIIKEFSPFAALFPVFLCWGGVF